MTVIKDGTGKGNVAGVDDLNRLETNAIQIDRQSYHNSMGKGFTSESELLTLTNASESAVWYMKNTGDKDIVVETIFFVLGTSTGGSGDFLNKVYFNPTGGTIVSDTVAANTNNLKFGNSNELVADLYKGSQGKTLTGGTVALNVQIPTAGLFPVDISTFVIPKGQSIGISITPPTGNTSVSVNFGINMYEDSLS